MVVGFKNQNQTLYENWQSKSCETMDNGARKNVIVNRNNQDHGLCPKEYSDEKSNDELSKIASNSNNWWPNDVEEKFEPRHRWSFGSDLSLEAAENTQRRLCCSPVDEFDSTVGSETEDVIVINTEQGTETYKPYRQLSPACSPTFKNVICNTNGQKQRKSHEVYTADDELVDYSKRYTTDSSGLMVETKPIESRIQQQQQRRMLVNNIPRPVPQKKSVNSRSKGYPFGDYAETDLDQPTDYSLRYAEEDTDEDEKEETHYYCSEQPADDMIKTYCTEGTPSNFSTATSMSDLLVIEDPREGAEAAYKPQYSRHEKQEIIEKSDKPSKDCKSRIRQKFVLNNSRIPILEETRQRSDGQICNGKVEKLCTPPQSPAEVRNGGKENKAMNFNVEESNYAQETPLMFSRSSSLDSLSEFDQASIQDDRSSVISDFSHRTSGAVSPSDLPDSPTQTVPPSPRKLERDDFSIFQQQQQQEHQLIRNIERENVQGLQRQQLMPKLKPQHQHQSPLQRQPQPPPLPRSQIQRVTIRPVSRNPTVNQPQNGHPPPTQRPISDVHAPIMQRSTPNGQVPLVQHPQMNNHISMMQRPRPEGRASQPQRPQPDRRVPPVQPNNRVPVVQRSQIENRGPVVQRSQVDRLINTTKPTIQSIPSPREPQLPQHIPERCISVFEDNLVRFKSESMHGKFSTAASSLSSLTIDDEDDNVSVDNREIINKIMAIRVRSSAAGMHQAPCTQRQHDVANNGEKLSDRQPQLNVLNRHSGYRSNGSHVPVGEENLYYVNIEYDNHDYTTSYSNKEKQNNRYRESPKEWYENEYKNDNRKQTINGSSAKSPVCNRNNNDIICHLQKREVPETMAVDTLQTYCTEDTPIFVSPYGSQSNLSGLSSLSISDDGEFGFGFIENERILRSPNFDEAERSNSRVDSYDESGENSNASDDEDEDKNYGGGLSLAARRRIDVSPFDSQMNLNFSLLRIEEEDEEAAEQKEEEVNNETDRSPRAKLPIDQYDDDDDDDDDYRRLSRRNSECSDDEVLEQCIKSGVSKVTRRSLDSKTVP